MTRLWQKCGNGHYAGLISRAPANDVEALTLALRLAVTAPTDEKAEPVLEHADILASRMSLDEVNQAKAATISTRVDRATAVAVLGVFLAIGIVFATVFIIPPLITVFVDEIGLSHSQAGDLMTAYIVGYVLLSLVAGQLADRYGAITVMAAGLALATASTFLFMTTESFAVFLVARLGIGAAVGLVYAPGIAVVARLLPRRHLNIGVGIYSAGLSTGVLLAFLVTPLLEEATSWRWVCIVFGITTAVATVVFLLLTRPVSARASRPADTVTDSGVPIRQLLISSLFMRVCGALFLAMFITYGVYTWIAPYLDESAGFSASQLSLTLSLSVAGGIPSALLTGWLADRTGRPVLVAGSGLAMVVTLLVLAANEQISFAVGTTVAIIATFGTAGALGPLYALPARIVSPAAAAKATGIATSVAMSGALVSTLLGGRLVEWSDGYTVPFIVYVAATGVALLVVFPLAAAGLRGERASGA